MKLVTRFSCASSVTKFVRNFATLAKFYKHVAIFLGLVSIWQHFEPTLAIFT